MRDPLTDLREMAADFAAKGMAAVASVITAGADEIERLRAENATLRSYQRP